MDARLTALLAALLLAAAALLACTDAGDEADSCEGAVTATPTQTQTQIGHVPQVGVTVHHPYQLLAGSLQQHLLA